MLDKAPSAEEMTALVGPALYDVWNKGGKAWTYEYKYRRGGKTLCALYAKENGIGFMIIFGKDERLKFEADRK